MISEADALRGAIVDWAAATPRIRRLWIGPAAIGTDPADGGITIAVEPRAVGDSEETLPVWMANCDAWHQQVQTRTGRRVRLEWYDPDEPPGTGGKSLVYDVDRF